jgi:hypothetical protein
MTGASLTEEDQGDQGYVEPFESGSGLPYSSLGGKRRTRRTRGKRNSRKRSQRKSKRYMKKMYRGGNSGEVKDELKSDAQKENQNQNQNQNQEDKQNGGRRRRKGKMNKGKTRKGKVSKWITHVKNFSRANKMDFRDALKDPKCKASYHKMK